MPEEQATVVATYSRRMRLRLQDGREVSARIKGKRLKPVCGDRVRAEPIDGERDWLITAVEERRSLLTRPNTRGDPEALAANIEHLTVVAAPKPVPDWFVVDRYLSAAESIGIPAAVVYNKIDLAEPDGVVQKNLDEYRRIGYDVIALSARTGSGVAELARALIGKTGIIVGQSGVGKSSLINKMAPGAQQKTAELSPKVAAGRHTTVNSVLLSLPGGGAIIDSPGVRDYAPALEDPAEVARGYREIAAAALDCRFHNCRHHHEPNCAVKAAVSAGTISRRRYASYLRLLKLTESLDQLR